MMKCSPELTKIRREEIIAACETLYRKKAFRDITIREIGTLTSFGRTSIYNYFNTKEEILLALLQREYEAWAADLKELAASGGPHTKEALASGLSETLGRRELLLKIMTMNLYDMEENSREQCLVDFKAAYGDSMRAVLRCLTVYCPEMQDSEKQAFLYAFFPSIYGIYPYTSVTEKQRTAMALAHVDYVYQSVYEIAYSFLKKLLNI